jgi:glyoxylase-like metal-dependent hydrolase (beta-lactamase superfamily II)
MTIPVGELYTNCYIIAEGEDCAVVDPGDMPDEIADVIDSKGLAPRYILLTHGHLDHMGAVKRLLRRYPGAQLCIGEGDLEMLTDTVKSYAITHSTNPEEYVNEGGVGLADGQELPLGGLTIRVMHTPGHTKGGVVYLVNDAIFAGDTLFRLNAGRTDLYGGDYNVLLSSLKKLADLPGDYAVYPGHREPTTLEFERRNNDHVRESMR